MTGWQQYSIPPGIIMMTWIWFATGSWKYVSNFIGPSIGGWDSSGIGIGIGIGINTSLSWRQRASISAKSVLASIIFSFKAWTVCVQVIMIGKVEGIICDPAIKGNVFQHKEWEHGSSIEMSRWKPRSKGWSMCKIDNWVWQLWHQVTMWPESLEQTQTCSISSYCIVAFTIWQHDGRCPLVSRHDEPKVSDLGVMSGLMCDTDHLVSALHPLTSVCLAVMTTMTTQQSGLGDDKACMIRMR